MGAGKGKTRRAQVLFPPGTARSADFNAAKWDAFVADNKLGRAKLHEYYFGQLPPFTSPRAFMDAVTEVFTDAVAVGAIVLPSPYEPEDFQFEIKTYYDEVDPDDQGYDGPQGYTSMYIAWKLKPELEADIGSGYYNFSRDATMADKEIGKLLRQVAATVEELVGML